jgi:hypothetical protein
MRARHVALMGLAMTVMVVPAQAQDTQVRLTGRVQVQYNTTSVSEEDVAAGGSEVVAASTFETRRVRLGVRLTIDDWIEGMLEPDFALGRLQLRQVWMNLGIDPAFELRVGQFKKPFSLIQLTSSLETSAIERGLRIRELGEAYAVADAGAASPVLGTWGGDPVLAEEQELLDVFGYMGYELGAMAHGQLGSLSYSVGVFNGTGADSRDENDGKSYAGRLVWSAPTSLPVAVGAGVSHHEVSTSSGLVDGTAFEVDLELGDFRREGLHLIAEATTGTNLAVDESFAAAQAMVSLFRPTSGERIEGIEPAFRVSWGDPDREADDDAGMLITPGINLYFMGRTRLMLNWDVYMPQGDRFDTKHALRAQAQLAF